jgi:N-acetylglucosamine-6-phosphate deacetylase
MSEFQVFLNGALVMPDGLIGDGLVVARGGVIEYAGPGRKAPADAEVIDAAGQYIAPGFIDLHVHGGGGGDFMDATPGDIDAVMRYHSSHGTTSLCPTTASAPLAEILAAMDALACYRSAGNRFGRALGAHIEGPYLNPSKKGCHLADQVRNPRREEWEQILERGPVASVTLAPELDGARDLIEALRARGATASAGHSEALFHEMREYAGWGVNHVTHLYCAMTDAMNNRWRLTRNPRAGGILEAVYLDERLTSELICDGRHLPSEMLRVALRMKGCEGLAIVTDAMRGAGMPDGEYTFGPRHGLMAVVREGEARVPDGTALASSVCPMNEMVRILRDLTGCQLWEAVRMATLTPATILRQADRLGSLAPGRFADILVFDGDVRISRVFVEGREIPAHSSVQLQNVPSALT